MCEIVKKSKEGISITVVLNLHMPIQIILAVSKAAIEILLPASLTRTRQILLSFFILRNRGLVRLRNMTSRVELRTMGFKSMLLLTALQHRC